MPSDGIPLCGSDEVVVTVHWQQAGPGLRGQVIAENVGSRACRLDGKPTVTPLATDGTLLPVRNVVTLEFVEPGYAVLLPGQHAAARLSWPSWCGQQASDRARVDWPGASVVASVHGPRQPDCDPDRASDIAPYWFFVQSDEPA
jgi:Protein of unknown function (DUF4232)